MRNNVSFRVLFPFDTALHPVGEEIAAYLENVLEARCGLRGGVENWRDSGYELCFTIQGKPMCFAFVWVQHPQFQFYGQVGSYVGWLRRWFGYRDQEEAETLIRAVHDTLTNDPNFRDVSWHEGWYDE